MLATNGRNVNWIEISGNGKNALDFHIAYYIAKKDDMPETMHFILSKDQGYDPLVAHINEIKNRKIVRRIVSLDDILENNKLGNSSTRTFSSDSRYEKVLQNLQGITNAKRPKSEKTLKSHIQALLKNENCEDIDIQKIIEELYRQKRISKGNSNRLSYKV